MATFFALVLPTEEMLLSQQYEMFMRMHLSPRDWKKMYAYERHYFIERWNMDQEKEDAEFKSQGGESDQSKPNIGKLAKLLYNKLR